MGELDIVLPPVMAVFIAPWPSEFIVFIEISSASTRAKNQWVVLPRAATSTIWTPMENLVLGDSTDDLQVVRRVIRRVAVAVMDHFSRSQWPSYFLLGNDAMLVG
jgi:hypothetical protein